MKDIEVQIEQLTLPRLPDDSHLGIVSLQVGELERSLAYYQQVIGLKLLEKTDGTALLGTFGDRKPLLRLHENKTAKPVPRRGRLGLYHFAILLPSRKELGKFLKHLADQSVYAGMSDHAFSEALYLSDPDGLGIEVYADRPRSSWQYKDNELVAATMPLDTQSVAQTAGDETWQGMPAGTVIGHIHFYVDDLNKAARFYHEGLGFDIMIRSYPGALFVSAGGYHHHVGLNTWAAGTSPAAEDEARLLSWELELGSEAVVTNAIKRLSALGFETEQKEDGWQAVDPWGSVVRLKTR